MKKIISVCATLVMLQPAFAINGYCNSTAVFAALDYQKSIYPTLVPQQIDVQVIDYVGFHSKRYEVILTNDSEIKAYEISIFEFENEAAPQCELNFISEKKAPATL
jgi:hypothetical protein